MSLVVITMPPFVPPSEPPALVQPVVPQPNRDRFPSFPSSRAVPSNDQDSATLSNPPDRAQSTPPLTANDAQPSSIPLSVTEVPPTVVEVYFSNPQEVSLPPGYG
ncbi:MAG: hypothetical protein ACRDEA_11965, partial [Microcystaceae cyanobacterium]